MSGILVQFYRQETPDDRGRMLDDIVAQNDDWLEFTHDYIQWLFPLIVRSGANPGAPILDARQIAAFRSDAALQQKVAGSFERMLAFYGLSLNREIDARPKIVRSKAFIERSRNWLTPFNHNFLRITRILWCLHHLGLGAESEAFFECLEEIHKEYTEIIGAKTFSFWESAARRPTN